MRIPRLASDKIQIDELFDGRDRALSANRRINLAHEIARAAVQEFAKMLESGTSREKSKTLSTTSAQRLCLSIYRFLSLITFPPLLLTLYDPDGDGRRSSRSMNRVLPTAAPALAPQAPSRRNRRPAGLRSARDELGHSGSIRAHSHVHVSSQCDPPGNTAKSLFLLHRRPRSPSMNTVLGILAWTESDVEALLACLQPRGNNGSSNRRSRSAWSVLSSLDDHHLHASSVMYRHSESE